MADSSRPRRIVGTSLKMYFDYPSTLSYIRAVSTLSALAASHNIDLFVIPDFTALVPAQQILQLSLIHI